MIKCENCGNVFDTPKRISDDLNDEWVDVCPYCDSEEINEQPLND